MSRLKDLKVFVLQSLSPFEDWKDATPGTRYSITDLMEFQDDLTWDDAYAARWRGYPMPGFERDVEPVYLEFRHECDDPRPFVHRTVPLDVESGECLPPTGWPLVMHMLGIKDHAAQQAEFDKFVNAMGRTA